MTVPLGWQLSSPPQVGRSFLSSGNTWTTHLGSPDCHVALITNAWSWHRCWHVLQLDDFSFSSYEKCGAVRSLLLDVGQRAKLRGDECGGMRARRLHSSPHHVIKEEAVLVDTFTEILYNLGRLKPSSIVNIALVWLLFSYKWRVFFPCKMHPPQRYGVYNILWETINDSEKKKQGEIVCNNCWKWGPF